MSNKLDNDNLSKDEGNNTEIKKTNYEVEEFNDWEDMKLKKNILRGIYSYGFEKPSPIQKKSY